MWHQRKLERGVRLCDNTALDRMSRVHPILPLVVWGPLIVAMIVAGMVGGMPWYHVPWLLLLGYVIWTFCEYFIHRALFHFQPTSRLGQRWFYYVHEHHHQFQERDRLVTPPLMAAPFFLLFLGLFYVTIGLPLGLAPMAVIWAGCGIGGLIYEYVHFYVHFAEPKSRLGRFLRRCHLQHHFVRSDCWFGISCPWIDFLFGTHLRRDQLRMRAPAGAIPEGYPFDALPPKVQDYLRGRAANL